MNRTAILSIAIGILLLIGGYAWYASNTVQTGIKDTPTATLEPEAADLPSPRSVTLFYYDPERDTDATGNILCSSDGLVPVTRTIQSVTPVEDTLRLLLRGELTDAERAAGVTTEYPLPGVAVSSVALAEDGTLRIAFRDPERKLVGGACRTGILAAQVRETALQFPEVSSVVFLPEDVFQP